MYRGGRYLLPRSSLLHYAREAVCCEPNGASLRPPRPRPPHPPSDASRAEAAAVMLRWPSLLLHASFHAMDVYRTCRRRVPWEGLIQCSISVAVVKNSQKESNGPTFLRPPLSPFLGGRKQSAPIASFSLPLKTQKQTRFSLPRTAHTV